MEWVQQGLLLVGDRPVDFARRDDDRPREGQITIHLAHLFDEPRRATDADDFRSIEHSSVSHRARDLAIRSAPILTALDDADHPLFMPPETKWYRIGELDEAGVSQFLVADPDGYLIRFQMPLGRRPIAQAEDTP